MPRIKKATDANGTTFYPITISKGVWDTTKNQRLSQTLSDLDGVVSSIISTSVIRDTTTGAKTIASAAVNTVYSYATISSLTVTALAAPTNTAVPAEYVFEFTLGSTVGTMSFPASVVWVDGRPEWKANKHYRVVVLYNAGDDHYFAYCEGTLGALGTAARKNVPTSGNASSSQVVMGNDTRLTNSRTPTSHTHGNIQNTGALQSSDVTIANGDKLVITDSSDSDKVARASVAFDGSTKTKALTKNGTFETFVSTAASQGLSDTEKSNARANIGAGTSSFSGSYNDLTNKPTIPAAVAVKGNAESSYRTGNVNITPANIGLGNVDNTADANKSVAYANSAGSAPAHTHIITQGDYRSDSTHPTDYVNNLIFRGLKYSNAIDYPSSDTYQYLVGLKGWGDSSGGDAWEVAFNNSGINVRHGENDATWSEWRKLATTSDIPSSLPANGGNANTVGGHHAHDFLTFVNDNANYVSANFLDSGLSQKAHQKYIEFWDGGTDCGWFNFMLGELTTTGSVNIEQGANLILKAQGSNSNDPGDIIFTNSSGSEMMRIYAGNDSKGYIRFGENDSSKEILHSGNWSSYITIPTVYSWAKASTKPSYTASEVGIWSTVSPITFNISSICSITGSSNAGKSQTIIYTNSTSSDLTVTVPTIYKTPDGAAIELTCKAGGYCEVNYLNIGGTIYARGL